MVVDRPVQRKNFPQLQVNEKRFEPFFACMYIYDYIAEFTRALAYDARVCLRSLESAPLDILVTHTTCPRPCPKPSSSSPLAPSVAYDIESRFYDASAGAPSRRRSRCKLLFASLEEIRLARRAPAEATGPPDGGRQRVVERVESLTRGGSRFYAGIKIWLLDESCLYRSAFSPETRKKMR